MADRPILFSRAMVRALLDGTKTQTRRVLHVQPPAWVNFCEQPDMFSILQQWVPSGLWRWAELDLSRQRALRQWPLDGDGQHYWLRPRFSVGDRLWVREAHMTFNAHGQHRSDGLRWGPWDGLPTQLSPDATRIAYFREGFDRCKSSSWKPGIHMPRWASRLTLAVTHVRVQQLQEITTADALAEGVERESADPPFYYVPGVWPHSLTAVGVEDGADHARRSYAKFWDLLNAKRGFGWDANPWVVAVTFSVARANIDTAAEKEAA